MAKKWIIVDDVDGTETDVATHRITVDGESYEIDLCDANMLELETVLRPYLSVARKLTSRGPRKKKLTAAPESNGTNGSVTELNREQRVAIRDWARENGYEVADRGAFSKEVLDAYRESIEEPH